MSKSPRAFLSTPRPLVFAHRGGAKLWPENTLEAFRGALALGCRVMETDLHLSRDGVIVAFHDERLERTTDGTGFLKHRTMAELERLDAGHRFTEDGKSFPFRGRGLNIPSFESLLELGSDVRYNVEIKQTEPPMVEVLWRFIVRHGLEDRILVAAARDPLVQEFRRISGGRVATSAGANESRRFWAATRLSAAARWPAWIGADSRQLLEFLHGPIAYDALQVPPRSGRLTVVDRAFVHAAHARDLHVHVWTVDEPEEMRRLLALDVDGLMSDRPDRVLELLRGTPSASTSS